METCSTDWFGRYLPSVTNHDLGRVLIGHNYGRLGETVAEGVWVVRSQGLLDHTNVMMCSDLVLITTLFSLFNYYWASEMIFSCFCLTSFGWVEVRKGMATARPLDIRTLLHDVTLVFANCLLDFSIFSWWICLSTSSFSKICAILWDF